MAQPLTQSARLKKLRELRKIARDRGGRLLSKEYVNGRTKMLWRCGEQHSWWAWPENIKQGTWCRKCFFAELSEAMKDDIDKMRSRARRHHGRCLSTKYVDAHTKLKWKCRWGHIFWATPANISQGKWCPVCGRKKSAASRKTKLRDIQILAKAHGAKLLSKAYVGIDEPLQWQCRICKYTWERSLHNAKRTKWCPRCLRNKQIKDLAESRQRRKVVSKKKLWST